MLPIFYQDFLRSLDVMKCVLKHGENLPCPFHSLNALPQTGRNAAHFLPGFFLRLFDTKVCVLQNRAKCCPFSQEKFLPMSFSEYFDSSRAKCCPFFTTTRFFEVNRLENSTSSFETHKTTHKKRQHSMFQTHKSYRKKRQHFPLNFTKKLSKKHHFPLKAHVIYQKIEWPE